MKSWFNETLYTIRALLGWENISDRRLTPAHGWLLPLAASPNPGAATHLRPAPAPLTGCQG